MKTPRFIALAAALFIACLQTGCDYGPVPPVGKRCTIQFRREALGSATPLPVSPLTGSINGAERSISGTLKSATGDWLVLDRGGIDVWVPRTVVLLIAY